MHGFQATCCCCATSTGFLCFRPVVEPRERRGFTVRTHDGGLRLRHNESIQIDILLEGRWSRNGPVLLDKLEAQFPHCLVGGRITGERFAPKSLEAKSLEIECDGLSAKLSSEACFAKVCAPQMKMEVRLFAHFDLVDAGVSYLSAIVDPSNV